MEADSGALRLSYGVIHKIPRVTRYTLSIEERFWLRVDKIPDGCWIYTGATNHGGYGVFAITSREVTRAHRFGFELFCPIPEGLELDHLCEIRRCVNWAHLEPVTHAENLRRWALRRWARAA